MARGSRQAKSMQEPGPARRGSSGRCEELYAAFLDPTALVDWLPPVDMTGEIQEFDARVGGGYRKSLLYPAGRARVQRQDVGQRGYAQRKEMSGGTEVTLVFKNLPSGFRAEDNEAGARLSLAQLARRFE